MARFAPRQIATVASAVTVKAGALRSWRRAKRRAFILFSAQCFDWIDSCGATRRDETGSGRNQCKQSGNGEINGRIECVDFEENVFEGSGRDDSEKQSNSACAQNKADRELPRSLGHNHAEDSLRVRAQRHADAEFLGALIHRKTHHAVETNRERMNATTPKMLKSVAMRRFPERISLWNRPGVPGKKIGKLESNSATARLSVGPSVSARCPTRGRTTIVQNCVA